MAQAAWTEISQGAGIQSHRSKHLTELLADVTTYSDPNVTYSSPLVFYNGYDTTGTPEGETGAAWTQPSSAPASWAKESE